MARVGFVGAAGLARRSRPCRPAVHCASSGLRPRGLLSAGVGTFPFPAAFVVSGDWVRSKACRSGPLGMPPRRRVPCCPGGPVSSEGLWRFGVLQSLDDYESDSRP